MTDIRIACAQLNLVVGDLDGNVARIADAYKQAEKAGAQIALFPELAITSYPPEDLLLRPAFVASVNEALNKLAKKTNDCVAVVGYPELDRDLFNSAAVCANGSVQGIYRKHKLPNYAVFDESRYFKASDRDGPLITVGEHKVAVAICEDTWFPKGPAISQVHAGADCVVVINASPYYSRRIAGREEDLRQRVTETGVPFVYVNLVGGQDELIFDGGSMVLDATGKVIARAKQFQEDLLVVDVMPGSRESGGLPTSGQHVLPEVPAKAKAPKSPIESRIEPLLGKYEEVYEALVLGTRDYVRKNKFASVLFGLSGGIDSALVAAIASDALGSHAVTAVMMPSRYSSDHSRADAEQLITNLGIHSECVEIETVHNGFEEILKTPFGKAIEGLPEENLQARIRGDILMAFSNEQGGLVLSTCNKSEIATGYGTLYGDMVGGFDVLKDVPKTLVFDLVKYRNEKAGYDLIPQNIIEKPPSAELRPEQRDDQSLPPYEELDPILAGYIEEDKSIAELEAEGFNPKTVREVARLVDQSEYKRRQSAPGPRVSKKAFGKDRRLPITNAWKVSE